tara:strand:+ start:1010 stop:1525 length:516 start_codon:yes stop_codon:yes gene_type:complete
MGKYKHHSGAIGGGVNLSKGKTPHDSLMKYMPIDDKASGLFKMAKPYSMGASMRGPLDKHGMHKGPDMYGKKHDGPSAYGKMHKGPNQMDPMYNGKPGVQKDDFEQFASPANQNKCPEGMAYDEARGGCYPSKKEEAKMKTTLTKKITTKPKSPAPPPKEKKQVQGFRGKK